MLFEFTNVWGKFGNLRRLSRVIKYYDYIITFIVFHSEPTRLLYIKRNSNPGVLKVDFYSPSQMLYIQSAKDIARVFFETPVINEYDVAALSPNAKLLEYAKLGRTKP